MARNKKIKINLSLKKLIKENIDFHVLFKAVEANEQPGGLVYLPDVVRTLVKEDYTTEEVKQALIQWAQESPEEFELRPESGMGTLNPEDKKLAPQGPGGIFLSYGRIKEY